MILRPLVKIHGGSNYIKKWIISNFPDRYWEKPYIETCLGGGSVLLNKIISPTEIANDIDWPLYNSWCHLKKYGDEFIKQLQQIEYSEASWKYWNSGYRGGQSSSAMNWYGAVKEIVLRRFSRGGMKKEFAWSDRLRGGKPGDINGWLTYTQKQLPLIYKRIQSVEFLNKDAIDLIKECDGYGVIQFIDPPWMKSTRTAKNVYDNETDEKWHNRLLDLILGCDSNIIILGRSCPLYDTKLSSWSKISRQVSNNSSQTKKKQKTEVALWKNFN